MAQRTLAAIVAMICGLLGAAGVLQARLDASRPVSDLETPELYVRSPQVLDRASLSFDAVVADIYWMRAIQHFGGIRRSDAVVKRYELLYPLLDLTTSLDPHFNAAYLFGAIFLAEPAPGGADRADLAVALLEKGLRHQPTAWRFHEQIGFVHYWYRQDYEAAASWFARGASIPGAPTWLKTLEATTRAEGGDLETSRRIWRNVIETAESDWMRETAEFRLAQVEASAAVDELMEIVNRFAMAHGRPPAGWSDLVRTGYLRGLPVDPTGVPFSIDEHGRVTVSPESRLHPLPARRRPRG